MVSMAKRLGSAAAVLGLVAGAAGRAEAVPIVTFNFTGTSNATGVTFSGSFSYDLATPARSVTPRPPGTQAIYEPSPAFPAMFSLSSGGVTYSSAAAVGSSIVVFDDVQPFSAPAPRDELVIILLGPEAVDRARLDIRLLDFDRTAFSSGALPATLDLAQFEVAILLQGRGEGGRPNTTGPLASLGLAPAAVPEPSTLAMGGIGGLLALGYGWRHRTRDAA